VADGEFRFNSAMRGVGITTGILAMAVLLTACATMDPEQQLGHTLRAYERVVRWNDLQRAASFRAEPDPDWGHAAVQKRLAGVRISRYTVVEGHMSPDGREFSQRVRIGYYSTDDVVERTLIDPQRWEYVPDKQRWYLVSPLPRFP